MDIQQIITYQLCIKKDQFSKEELLWMRNFINMYPKTLNLIVDEITEITEDGKIEYHDIPTIIKIISQVYHSETVKNELFNKKNIVILIRFTMDSLLESKFLFLPDIETEIIEKMIDSSLYFLQYELKDIKPEDECCINLFSHFIGL